MLAVTDPAQSQTPHIAPPRIAAQGEPARRQGILVNWRQFTLQMVLILCVGLTIGTERTVLPVLGRETFHVQSFLFISSFVISFGVVKALLNLVGGRLSERYGRKPLLVAGWVTALPIPVLLIAAPSWSWVIAANALLGINQGLAWSMSVNAKIDLAGSAWRGLAVGLDEAGGYGGVALAALITGYLAGAYGLRPAPFIFGGTVIVLALLLTVFLMQETLPYAQAEARRHTSYLPTPASDARAGLSFPQIFVLASLKDRTMFALSQAGGVEKFVDALVWIAYPLYLRTQHVSVEAIGTVVFAYGMVWGIGQLACGYLADLIGRKIPIAAGMVACSIGVWLFPAVHGLAGWLLLASFTGLGMALLYPNLMTAAADAAHPSWRATGLGVYRFWRDAGYAVGAIFIGLTANVLGLPIAFHAVAVAMAISTLVLIVLMKETRPGRRRS